MAALQGHAFRDGVFLVDLAQLTDHALVPEALASSLDVPEHSGRDAALALETFLASRELLLVVDNCEHVAEAVRPLLGELLRRAPGLRVLATSREVLGISGELTYRVEPLAVPDEAESRVAVETVPAVALFVERATAAAPGFELREADVGAVLAICRELDGMPLALELAAAQLRVLSPGDLAARLDDRFRLLSSRRDSVEARHRTLRAAVEWSYDLCDKLERRLWERVSVFAGEFELDALETVCCDDLVTSADVVDVIRGLVDKSILSMRVVDGASRFRLLDTLRRYGLDRLREEEQEGVDASLDELALRARHLDWYADLSCRFEAEWIGPHQHERLARMRADLPDIRAALGFALEHPEHTRTGLRMAAALCWFWGTTAALREGHNWLVRLLDVGRQPCQERSRALSALSVLMVTMGAPEGGLEVAEEALTLARTEDPDRLPRVLDNVGMILIGSGDPGALSVLRESLDLCRERGLRDAELAFSTYALGYGLGVMRRTEESEALLAESITLCQELGDAWWLGVVRMFAALFAWTRGDLPTAEAHAVEGLRACRLVPDLHACAVGLNVVALVRVGRDDAQAARLLGAADRYWSDAGGSMFEAPVWVELVHGATQRCRAALGAEAYERAFGLGREDTLEEAAARALGEPVPPVGEPVPGAAQGETVGLTRREREVAALVAEGLSNRDIADRLVISSRTAETHVQNMLAKTGFRTRSQLAVWYSTRPAEDAS